MGRKEEQGADPVLLAGGGSDTVWSDVFKAVQDPIIIVTPEGRITEVNPAAAQAARKTRKEIVGEGICQIIHGGRLPHIQCPLEEFLLTKSRQVQETKLPGLYGDYLLTISPVRDPDGEVRQIMLIARDLTREEVRKVESIRTAQLAAIGELAAGVAHEVNYPINGIINYAQLLLDDCQEETVQSDLLQRIVKEGERISSIIYELLSFAREGDNDKERVCLNQIVNDCLALVQHQLSKDGIDVATDFAPDICPVVGNARQLKQVVFNTLSNSRYALNRRFPEVDPEKKIAIRCFRVEVDGVGYIRTSIKDLGSGIPQGILDKLFDPFFTSKPPGEGTGLGLSISHGIVRDHGGVMRVDSVLHKYTEITVDIPVDPDDFQQKDCCRSLAGEEK